MRRKPWNGARRGRGLLLVVTVVSGACDSDSLADWAGEGDDVIAPAVLLAADQVPAIVEPVDTVSIEVQAIEEAGGSGLETVGTVIVSGGAVLSASIPLSGEPTATRSLEFPVSMLPFDGADSLDLSYYGWAVDRAGNCRLAGGAGVTRSCALVNGVPVIGDLAGHVATVRLAGGAAGGQES